MEKYRLYNQQGNLLEESTSLMNLINEHTDLDVVKVEECIHCGKEVVYERDGWYDDYGNMWCEDHHYLTLNYYIDNEAGYDEMYGNFRSLHNIQDLSKPHSSFKDYNVNEWENVPPLCLKLHKEGYKMALISLYEHGGRSYTHHVPDAKVFDLFTKYVNKEIDDNSYISTMRSWYGSGWDHSGIVGVLYTKSEYLTERDFEIVCEQWSN